MIATAVLAGIALLCGRSAADACSCAPISREQMLPTVTDVFIATVAGEIEPQASPAPGMVPFSPERTITYELDVSESLKGRAKGRVAVVTGRDSASCGFPFQKGKRYLVFARRGVGTLRTGLCLGNVEDDAIAPAAAEVKQLLLANPKTKGPKPR